MYVWPSRLKVCPGCGYSFGYDLGVTWVRPGRGEGLDMAASVWVCGGAHPANTSAGLSVTHHQLTLRWAPNGGLPRMEVCNRSPTALPCPSLPRPASPAVPRPPHRLPPSWRTLKSRGISVYSYAEEDHRYLSPVMWIRFASSCIFIWRLRHHTCSSRPHVYDATQDTSAL